MSASAKPARSGKGATGQLEYSAAGRDQAGNTPEDMMSQGKTSCHLCGRKG